jgi:hypothetical protein
MPVLRAERPRVAGDAGDRRPARRPRPIAHCNKQTVVEFRAERCDCGRRVMLPLDSWNGDQHAFGLEGVEKPRHPFGNGGGADQQPELDISLLGGLSEVCRRNKHNFTIDDYAFGMKARPFVGGDVEGTWIIVGSGQ